jgi:hypothetical protein
MRRIFTVVFKTGLYAPFFHLFAFLPVVYPRFPSGHSGATQAGRGDRGRPDAV